jgi:nitrate reductase gamma subunit
MSTLEFAQGTLQEIALVIMGLVYTTRIIWLLRFKPYKERQATTAGEGASTTPGIAYSLANIAMPWAMESTRTNLFFYLQFVLFHIGVTAAIVQSFIIPYAPGWLEGPFLVILLQVFIGLAFIVGVGRMIRRVANPYMRLISTPDDYFSLALLIVWFFFAFWAAPNNITGGEGIMLTYFILTAFFLIYVPFSKISHYLYYPFTRFWLGKTMAYRGVFPTGQQSK